MPCQTHSARPSALLLLLLVSVAPARAQVVNNCLPQDYADRRGQAAVTVSAVTQPGIFRYTPRCLVIDIGATVNFTLDFGTHPTIGGRVIGGSGMPDPDSPIGAITSGTTRAVVFAQPRLYGFYCDFHVAQAMMGAIEVPFVDGFE